MVKLSLSTKWRPGEGSRGIVPLILNLRARHVWWTSCCSQSPHPHPGEISSDTNGIGGWVGSRTSLMFWEENSLTPNRIRTPDHPADSVVTLLTTILLPFKKTENLWVIGSCKFNYYRSLSDIKLRFKKVKLSLFMPWRYIWGSGGVASLILNLATRWEWLSHPARFMCEYRVPGIRSTRGWLLPRVCSDVNWTKIYL